MGIRVLIVGYVRNVKRHFSAKQGVLATHSLLGWVVSLSREIIAKPDYPFLSYSTPTVVWPLAFSMLHTHFGESPVASHSRDLVAKILWMLTHLNSSHSSHTQPLHNSHLNTRYLIVELQANLAQNKANTWLNKFNLTISPLWLFHDKTLKHTLNLKCELGTVAKTHSHLTLDYVQLLNHTDKFSWKQ